MATSDLLEALQKLPDYRAAKTVTDYMEENKNLNIQQMKDLFATKEDLLNTRNEISKEINRAKFQVIIAVVIAVFLQPAFAMLYKKLFGI